MHDVLKRILARKQEEVAERSARVPLAELQARNADAPAVRGPQIGPAPRAPTLENGGIGNGYPRPGSTPAPVKPYVSPAPPPRDPDTSNR